MKQQLKEEKQMRKGGLLSQTMNIDEESQMQPMEANTQVEEAQAMMEGLRTMMIQEQAKSDHLRAMMQQELEAQRLAAQETQMKNEKMIQSILMEKMKMAEDKKQSQVKATCKCGQEAELLTVKKEGPRKGKRFWKCAQRQCDFFLWEQLPEGASTLGSFSIVGSSAAASVAAPSMRRRSKSPRRSQTDTAGGPVINVGDSD